MPPKASNKRAAPESDGSTKRVVIDLTEEAAPTVASSSSSSSAAASMSQYSGKFLFVKELCRSYTLAELWTVHDNTRAALPPVIEPCVDNRIDVRFPCGGTIKVSSAYFSAPAQHVRDKGMPPRWLSSVLIDWSRTSGQTDCPLSAEEFVKPHILSSNGRSYSLAAIQDAVAKTLAQGEQLRLEDITLTTPEVTKIELYPNYSLPGWELLPGVVHFKGTIKPEAWHFAADRAREKNDPEVAALFDRPLVPDSSGLITVDHIVKAYQTRHNTRLSVVENLVVAGAVFPRGHVKEKLSIRNVLFRDCVMILDCWCGLLFVGCRFERCMIISKDSNTDANFHTRVCEFDACEFILRCPPERVAFGPDPKSAPIMKVMSQLRIRTMARCSHSHIPEDTFEPKFMQTASAADFNAKLSTFTRVNRGLIFTPPPVAS